MRVLLVGGTFDNEGGKASSLIEHLISGVKQELDIKGEDKLTIVNGGFIKYLSEVLIQPHALSYFDAVLWFANIDNSELKFVQNIKKIRPSILLVTSKRCIETDYNKADVVAHALNIKSNLVLEIRKPFKQFTGGLLDPLGNVFELKERGPIVDITDFEIFGKLIIRRLRVLKSFTRMGSVQASPEKKKVPDEKEFFKIIRKSADVFNSLLPTPTETKRFLGNASFRCARGFPSFKKDNLIFVSRRNIDKKFIGPEGFVAVDADNLPVRYYGEAKPSVDTPVQLMLYQYYSNVKYMLHGHVEVEEAKDTNEPISCGALEEASAIIRLEPDFNKTDFVVNLSGHGFLALASTPQLFSDLFNEKKYSATTNNLWSI